MEVKLQDKGGPLNDYNKKKSIPGRDLGFAFMRFCSKYNLEQLGKNPTDIIEIFKQKLVIE